MITNITNFKTFFLGWIGLAVISGLRSETVDTWPADMMRTKENMTDPKRFLNKSSCNTYIACTWTAALVAMIFGVFKCRSFAEILFGLSETDGQLELREKHYEKIKRKSLYWIAFLVVLFAAHATAFFFML
jgi:hypothetical protein